MKRVSKALYENVLGTGISTQHGLNTPLPLTALRLSTTENNIVK
ncbi:MULTISPECIES: hypothetical protein [unclassified Nostoc]|nr:MULTISPECIES: hypothetical protein [unclassified Nostoc]MDM9584860.1 hypothetical protein [Nostoc sp. GT001]MDZ7948453.1 hypothetical protein [Nostoc sp. EfeVER01]MDZ7991767.1 hypothetical protein [Nostoc sp. EspVER01]